MWLFAKQLVIRRDWHTVIVRVLCGICLQPLDAQANSVPDPLTSYELFDRVVNVREGYSVPLGLRGTVIGISPGLHHLLFNFSMSVCLLSSFICHFCTDKLMICIVSLYLSSPLLCFNSWQSQVLSRLCWLFGFLLSYVVLLCIFQAVTTGKPMLSIQLINLYSSLWFLIVKFMLLWILHTACRISLTAIFHMKLN